MMLQCSYFSLIQLTVTAGDLLVTRVVLLFVCDAGGIREGVPPTGKLIIPF